MGKPNYNFAKRQKELAKKKKQDEKRKRKLIQKDNKPENDQATSGQNIEADK